MAQVGKGRVTAPAIYLIETGRTRPSLPTLEHIAERTGKPVEFFLADPSGVTDETQVAMVELEARVAEGRSDEALVLGQRLLALGSSAFRLGRIRYLLALANLQSGQPAKAATLLAEARTHFEAVNDNLMLAECLSAQAELAGSMHEPDAIPLARQALALCRSLKPVPALVEARLLGILATALVGNREWEGAIASYQEAIAAAGSLLDLRRIAKMYGELSAAYRGSGQGEAAARYASRSAALMEVVAARLSVAHSENALGLILRTRGKVDEGRGHLNKAVELAEASNVEVGDPNVLLSLCELSLSNDNPEQAQEFAYQALQLAERRGDKAGMAEAHVSLSRIHDRLGDAEAVDREFELAIAGLEQLGLRDRLLQCHGAYAEILERRGEMSKAYLHMKKAVQASRPRLIADDEDEEQEGTA